jgi:hypothetical protein
MWTTLKNYLHRITAPVEPENLTGLALVQHFTTDDEPKVADYPKGKYKVYWEIFVNDVPGGYSAVVRFYEIGSGVMVEQNQFIEPSVYKLKPFVNEYIRTTMAKYAR